jgi:hypothetical protein
MLLLRRSFEQIHKTEQKEDDGADHNDDDAKTSIHSYNH